MVLLSILSNNPSMYAIWTYDYDQNNIPIDNDRSILFLFLHPLWQRLTEHIFDSIHFCTHFPNKQKKKQ